MFEGGGLKELKIIGNTSLLVDINISASNESFLLYVRSSFNQISRLSMMHSDMDYLPWIDDMTAL
jgi:hypothetical protein